MSPEELKAALAKPGRSQSGLARHMGLDQSAVNRLVNGKRRMLASEIAQVEEYLATDAEERMTPLARRAKERLDELGLTPITAATKAGLDRDLFRNMFRGDAMPRADTLASLCKVLEVSADWLLFGTPSVVPPSPLDNSEALFQPASRPGGSEETGRQPPTRPRDAAPPEIWDNPTITAANGRVTLNINATVSLGVASQILALIEGDQHEP